MTRDKISKQKTLGQYYLIKEEIITELDAIIKRIETENHILLSLQDYYVKIKVHNSQENADINVINIEKDTKDLKEAICDASNLKQKVQT